MWGLAWFWWVIIVILWVLFGLVRQLSELQQAAASVPGPPESS